MFFGFYGFVCSYPLLIPDQCSGSNISYDVPYFILMALLVLIEYLLLEEISSVINQKIKDSKIPELNGVAVESDT